MNTLDIYSCDYAMESFSIDKIKAIGTKIVTNIKSFIQIITNWVSTKFMKLFHMEIASVDQHYFNEMKRVINKVNRVDTISISSVLMKANVFVNNEDNIKKYGDQIARKLEEIEDLANNAMQLKPVDSNRKINISTSTFKSLKSSFEEAKDEAYKKMACIRRAVEHPEDPENLKYTHAQIVLIGRLSAIDFKKNKICIDLINKLCSNCKINTDEDKKSDENNRGNNMNRDNVKRIAGESFIEEITMESFKDGKKIFKNGMQEIKDKVTTFNNMPESTVAECDAKLKACNELIHLSYVACQDLRKVKPGNIDKFVSGISYILGTSIDMMADTNIRSAAYGFGPQSPNLAKNVQTMGAMIGVKWIARAITKGTIGQRMERIKDLIDKMVAKNQEFNQEYDRIYKLKRELADKEKESQSATKSATENFINYCDSMMIANEGKLTEAVRNKIQGLMSKLCKKYDNKLRNQAIKKLEIMKKILSEAKSISKDSSKEIDEIMKNVEVDLDKIKNEIPRKELKTLLRHIDSFVPKIIKLSKKSDIKGFINISSSDMAVLNQQLIAQQQMMMAQQNQIVQQQLQQQMMMDQQNQIVQQQLQQQTMNQQIQFAQMASMPINMGGFMPNMF